MGLLSIHSAYILLNYRFGFPHPAESIRDGLSGNTSAMARKTLNRKELREQSDAAEAAGIKPEKKAKVAKEGGEAKKPTKRKSRAKEPAVVRMKVFWGVFNQSMKCIAKYDFQHKKSAEQKASELTANGKSPHFVQKVKEIITE